jgi:Uma2 family endonuclease
MAVSEATYERLALEDPEGQWELRCGRPRSKPGMTTEHNYVLSELDGQLRSQLDSHVHLVSVNAARLKISTGAFYIPDLCVVPRELQRRRLQESPWQLEVYDEPMPLVVEVWSPSTGEYDVEEKLREYQLRHDREIWRLHPYDRTLTVWRLQPEGSGYSETLSRDGSVQPAVLRNVVIRLDGLFPS